MNLIERVKNQTPTPAADTAVLNGADMAALNGADTTERNVQERLQIMDESAKREVRRALLAAVAIPGYQVPFASREMPVARGWGSGGLQITLAVIGSEDVLKVYDQGEDGGVNAANLRRLIRDAEGVTTTTDSNEADVIQTRHRVPEEPLVEDQILVLQVPIPEPLRAVERDMKELARMHAEGDYSKMWVSLYEDIVRNGVITKTTGYPCLINGRYILATTPIPRWDVPPLHQSAALYLFGAGREKRVYAIPPHTDVEPLTFDDICFEVEDNEQVCSRCNYANSSGTAGTYVVELPTQEGASVWVCSDTDFCNREQIRLGLIEEQSLETDKAQLW